MLSALFAVQTMCATRRAPKIAFSGYRFHLTLSFCCVMIDANARSQVCIVLKTTYLSYECCIRCAKAKYEIQKVRIAVSWNGGRADVGLILILYSWGKSKGMILGLKTRQWSRGLIKQQMLLNFSLFFNLSPLAAQPYLPNIPWEKDKPNKSILLMPCTWGISEMLWQPLSLLFTGG